MTYRETLRLEGTLYIYEVKMRPVCWDLESRDVRIAQGEAGEVG